MLKNLVLALFTASGVRSEQKHVALPEPYKPTGESTDSASIHFNATAADSVTFSARFKMDFSNAKQAAGTLNHLWRNAEDICLDGRTPGYHCGGVMFRTVGGAKILLEGDEEAQLYNAVMPHLKSRNPTQTGVSFSYLNIKDTPGTHYPVLTYYGVVIILKPGEFEVRCAYPVDAYSDVRQGIKCGYANSADQRRYEEHTKDGTINYCGVAGVFSAQDYIDRYLDPRSYTKFEDRCSFSGQLNGPEVAGWNSMREVAQALRKKNIQQQYDHQETIVVPWYGRTLKEVPLAAIACIVNVPLDGYLLSPDKGPKFDGEGCQRALTLQETFKRKTGKEVPVVSVDFNGLREGASDPFSADIVSYPSPKPADFKKVYPASHFFPVPPPSDTKEEEHATAPETFSM